MNRTTTSRRKRWFFARAMARAYREMLEQRRRKRVQAEKRQLFAEALEPRVLFSGVPASDPEAANEEQAQDAATMAQTAEMLDGVAESGLEGMEGLLSDSYLSEISDHDLERLAREAVSRWEESGLTVEQQEALEKINFVVTDLGGLSLAAAEGDTIYLDDDAAGLGWFIDDTEWLDEEFVGYDGYLEAITDQALEGIDLLTVIMHEQGHILGLDDVYDASEIDGLLYGGFEEGVRKLPAPGEAEGALPFSLKGRSPASVTVTNFLDNGDSDVAGGTVSLREAINQAVDNDVITLVAGTYLIQIDDGANIGTTPGSDNGTNENANASGDFDINGKTITIQGAGKTSTFIDAQQLDRVFHIYGGANVTLKDLTITGGSINYSHGGGLHIDGTATVVHLENVAIDGNAVQTENAANNDRHGGGLWINNATVTAVNVDVTNNSATRFGSGRNSSGAGMWVSNAATVTFNDSVISDNVATHSAGGGVYVTFGATLNLNGVTMERNEATGGGAVFTTVGSTIHIANSATTQTALRDNHARNDLFGVNTSVYGGALRSDGGTVAITGDLTMGDILIEDNWTFNTRYGTSGFGGAFGGGLSFRTEAQVTLEHVTISGNTVDNSASNNGEGGGLFIEQLGTKVTGTDVTISDNTARVHGGGFRIAHPGVEVTLTDSIITGNTATNAYGGGFHNNGNLTLNNTAVEGNETLDLDAGTTAGHGGGFYNGAGGILTFDADSDVRSNSSRGSGAGGFNDQGVIYANGNTWENNFVSDTRTRSGGGLWNYLGAEAHLDSVIFQNNATTYNTGGTIQGTGGAIYNSDQATLNITGASVIQNNLAATGAGISNASNGSVVNITGTAASNVLIQGNWARADGGGLRNGNELSAFNLDYVTIQNNIAEASDGGGIANQNGIIRGNYVTIHNNAAGSANDHDGGGIYAVNRSDIVFTNSVVSNNAAGDDGGGVFVATVPIQVRFENSVITGNKTGIDHRTGTTYVDGANILGDITVLGDVTTALSSTHTAADGGGIYGAERANITLIDSSVTDNISGGVGGGIAVEDDSQLAISGSLIKGNMAGYQADGTTVTVINKHGGGIYTRERVQMTLDSSVIKENETSGQGGGLYQIEDSTVTVTGSTFEANLAGREGGGYYQTSGNSRSNVYNTTFTGNQAGFFSDSSYIIIAYDAEASGNVASDLAVGQTISTLTGSGEIVNRVQNTNSTVAGYLLLKNVTGTFTNNQAIDNGASTTALVNGNGALGDGGGVYMGNGIMNLVHTTVTGNTATDVGGGIRRQGGTLNFLNSVASNNSGVNASHADLSGTIAATTSYQGAATLTASTGVTVGASLAGGTGTTTVQEVMTVFLPDSGDTNIAGAVTTELLASDQNGGGRGGSAVPSDLGAIELAPLTSAITLDSLTVPTTWISGNLIELSAVASATGTGGGDLRFSWSVSGGTSVVTPEDHDIASPGLGEEDSFTFTHTISSADTVSETLTVTLTITDLTTGQTVTETKTVSVINPDAMPTAPVGTIEVTTAADVVDGADGLTSLREAITAANASGPGDYVITFAAGLDATSIITTISGAADDGNAREDYDITKSNGAVFIKGNGITNTIIDGGGLDRVFDIRPNATAFFSDLTITGGVTVDVDHGAGFRALGSTVILNDVEISGNQSTRGTTNAGGGFYATHSGIVGATVVMKGGSIRENIAGGHGGGWYASGNLASSTAVFMEDVTITGNASINEATVQNRDGGGFYFTGQNNVLDLKNVIITDNAARDDGGGFYFGGEYNTATFDNVTIQRNVVEGAVQDADDSTSFDAVTFNNQATQYNSATQQNAASGRDGGGGQIEATNSTVTFIGGLIGGDRNPDGTIKDGNYADNNGAGLAIKGNSTVNFIDTVIRGNFAEDSGGGVNIEGPSTVTFTNGGVIDNFSIGEHGGGLRIADATVSFDGTSISNNFAGDRIYSANPGNLVGGAMHVTNAAKVALVDVIMNNNQAEGRGGAIFADRNSVIDFSSSTPGTKISEISGNTTIDGGTSLGGGAVYLTHAGTTLNLTDATVSGNRSADDAGAIFIQGASTATLTRVEVSGNESQNQGGGIFLESDQSLLNLDTVEISGNATRVSNGGGILTNGTVTGNNVLIQGNRTGYDLDTETQIASGTNDRVGGGIYIAGAEASFVATNVVIADNQTYGRGGGVFISDGKLDLTNFVIRNNETNSDGNVNRGRGGGVYSELIGTVFLENGEISGNRAEGHGGGLYQASDGTVAQLTNVTVSGNSAGYDPDISGFADRLSDGGGLYTTNNSSLTLSHVTVADNNATRNGGGVTRAGGVVTYRNSILADNFRDVDVNPIASDNNATATLEGNVIIVVNQGGGLNQSNGTWITENPQLEDLADNGSEFPQLRFNGETSGFSAGETVTGGTSGATATVTHVSDLGTSGLLILADISGTFLDGEALTSAGGSATAEGGVSTATLPGGFAVRTHSFAPGSSALEAGASDVATDARGFGRPAGDARDLGAYERSVPVLDVTATPTTIAEGSTVTLSGEIIYDLFGADTASGVILRVDWGDGTEGHLEYFPGTTDFSATTQDVDLTHDYGFGTDGEFTLTVTLQDAVNGPVVSTETFSVSVTDTVVTVLGSGRDLTASTTEDSTVTINPFATGTGTATRMGDLTISMGELNATGNRMGFSVDISGDVAVVGGEGRDGEDEVWVYRLNGGTGTWDLEQRLFNDNRDEFDDFGYAVSVVDTGSSERIFVGAQLDDTGGSDKGAVYYYQYNNGTSQWDMIQKIQGTTGHDGSDFFGGSTAITKDGQYLAVGAPREDSDTLTDSDVGGSNDSGAVFIFSFNGTNYVQEDKIKAQSALNIFDNQGGDQFGQSVAIDGNGTDGYTLVVGTELADDVPNNSGAAYIYVRNGVTWDWQAKFSGTNVTGIDNDDRFGYRVAISGDTVAVGSRQADAGGGNTGQVNIFTRTGSIWTEAQVIGDADDSSITDNDQFGVSVDLDGDRLIVGSWADDNPGGTNSGTAYIFDRTGAAFTLTEQLEASDNAARDAFGWAVAIDGDNYIVGSRQANLTYQIDAINEIDIPDYGAAHIFSGVGAGNINQVGTRLDGDPASLTRLTLETGFGSRVAIEGDYAIVGQPKGAKGFANGDERTGQAHVYHRNDNGTPDDPVDDTWDLIATLAPPIGGTGDDNDDYFGWGVNISENGAVAVVTAIFEDSPGSNSGALFVFERNPGGDYDYLGRIKSDPTSNDNMGRKVDISGDGKVVVVGIPLDDDAGGDSGSVVVYDVRDTGTYPNGWSSFFTSQSITSSGAKLLPVLDATTAASDQFGYAVAIDASGNRLVVGAWDDDYPADNNANNDSRDRGSAYVFDWNGTDWVQLQKIFASNNGKDDRFGRDVDIDGSVIVVGSFAEDSTTSGDNNSLGDAGAAYVFEFNSVRGLFEETQILKASDADNSDQFGINVAIDGNDIVVGAHVEDTGGNEAGSAYVFRRSGAGEEWVNTDVLRNPNPGEGVTVDQFGAAVDVSNGVVLVGAPNDSFTLPNGVEAANFGSVYSYSLSADIDSQSAGNNAGITDLGELFVPDGLDLPSGNRIGYAVHIDGNLAIVGSEGMGHTEEVYIYRDTTGSGNWVLEATLFNPAALSSGVDKDAIDYFGQAVSIIDSGLPGGVGDRAFIGARLEDSGGGDKGRVYFYEFDGTNWVLKQQITDGNGGDDFGWALAADGEFLAVSARLEDSSDTDPTNFEGNGDSGAVWTYLYNSATGLYERTNKLKQTDENGTVEAFTSDQFGYSVALDSATGTLVIGQSLEDKDALGGTNDAAANSGATYVYVWNAVTSQFDFQQKLKAGNVGADDRFGEKVDISGDTIVVGANLEDTGNNNTGAAYVFTRTAGVWTQSQQLGDADSGRISDDDRFGDSVAIDGDRIIVSGRLDDTNGSNSGSVWVYERTPGDITNNLFSIADANGFAADDTTARDEFGYHLSMDGGRYLIGARLADATFTANDTTRETLTISQWGAAYIFEAGTGGAVTQQAKLDGDLANHTEIGGSTDLGRRVAVSGDYAVVGAPLGGKGPNVNDERTGQAFVYHREDMGTADTSDDTWSLVSIVAPPDSDDGFDDYFGQGIDISEDGRVLTIGAFNHEGAGGGRDRGAIYVYEMNTTGDGYDLQGRIRPATINGNTNDIEFGRNLTLNEDGSVLAVGRWLDDGADGTVTNVGSVFIYDVSQQAGADSSDKWDTFLQANGSSQNGIDYSVNNDGIVIYGENADDRFGRSLALSGTTLVVGAHQNDDGGGNRGKAYVYDRDSGGAGTWGLTQSFQATTDVGNNDHFGIDVDIDGDKIIVGAYLNDSDGSGVNNSQGDSGAAYIFTRSGAAGTATWSEAAFLKSSEPGLSDQFGINVAIDGDVAVVGAFAQDTGGINAGSAYVFQNDGGSWTETNVLRAPNGDDNDNFGRAVDVANGSIIVGAPGADRILDSGLVIRGYGAAYAYQVVPISINGNALTISSVGDPNAYLTTGSITTDGSTITFDPGEDFDYLQAGESVDLVFTYTLSDGVGGTATEEVVITVHGINDSPVATDETITTDEDNPGSGTLAGFTDQDTNNTDLKISAVNGDSGNVGTAVALAGGGTVTINANGTYSIDPAGAYESLADGTTANGTVNYTVTDSEGRVVYQPVDGALVGEAIDTSSRVGNGWSTIDEANAGQNVNSLTGSRTGTFLQVPETTGGILNPSGSGLLGSPALKYQVEIQEAGTYTLYVRGAAFDGNSDSIYASIVNNGDGVAGGTADWFRVGIPNSGAFAWVSTGIPEVTDGIGTAIPLTFDLGVGIHTIHLSAREDGVALDSWMLRKSDSTIAAPSGTDAGPAGQLTATVTVEITGVNDNPVITSDGGGATASVTAAENQTAVTTVTASDVDLPAQNLTFTITGGADAALFNITAGGVLTFITPPDFENATDAGGNGVYDVQVTVTDDGTVNLTDVQDIAVTVTNANDAPVISSDGGGATASVTAAENQTAVTTVTATDIDLPAQNLTFTITGGGDAALFNITAGGVLTFNSPPDFENATDAGDNGVYDVQVTVTDNGSLNLTDVQDIAVTVTNANDAPDGTDNTISVAEDTPYTFVSADFGFNDVDTGDTLKAVRIDTQTLIAGSTLRLNGLDVTDGDVIAVADITSLVYTPAPNANGNGLDSFTFSVQDNLDAFDATPNTMTIDVTAVNDEPVVENITNAVSFDVNSVTPVNIDSGTLVTITDDDSPDFNGGVLTVEKFSGPSDGDLTADGTTVQSGGDSVFAVGETVTVNGISVGTVAADGQNGASLTINLSAGATPATVATLLQNVQFSGPTVLGTQPYTYLVKLNDGDGGDTTAGEVTINLSDSNSPPEAQASSVTTNEDTNRPFVAGDFNFSDADGDSLVGIMIQSLSLAAGDTLQLSGSNVNAGQTILAGDIGNLVYTPAADASGAGRSSFDFTVNDANTGTVSATMTINVTAVADTPNLTTSDAVGNEDTAIPLDISASLVDTDGSESLAIVISGIPVGAVLSDGGNSFTATVGTTSVNVTTWDLANLEVTPPANSDGEFTLTFTATSTESTPTSTDTTVTTLNANTVGTINVRVDAVADAPTLDLDSGTIGNQSTGTASGNEDTAIALDITGALLDTDGSEELSFTISGVPAGATLSAGTNNGGGNWTVTAAQAVGLTITPPLNDNSDFNLTVIARATEANPTSTDTTVDTVTADSAAGTIAVTVNPVNDVPVLGATPTMTLNEGQTVAVTAATVGNPTDVDDANSALTVTVSSVTNGRFERTAAPGVAITTFTVAEVTGGAIRFVHDGGEFAPTYSVVVADDETANTGAALAATITFNNVNDVPVANADTNEVYESGVGGQDVAIGNALGNDTDADIDGVAPDDVLAINLVGFNGTDFAGVSNASAVVPGGGTVSVNGYYGTLQISASGGYVYSLDNNLVQVRELQAGETRVESFSYQVSDGNGGSDVETIIITIQGAAGATIGDQVVSGGSSILERFTPTEPGAFIEDDNESPFDESVFGPVFPTYAGTSDPGSAVKVIIFDSLGNISGQQEVVADRSGAWTVRFNLILGNENNYIQVQTMPASWSGDRQGVTYKTYLSPSINGSLGVNFGNSEDISVHSIFGRRLSGVGMEEVVAESQNPLGSNQDWRDRVQSAP